MAAVEQQIKVTIEAVLKGLPEVKAFALAVKSMQNSGGGVNNLKNEFASLEGGLGRVSLRLKDTDKSLLGVAVRGEGVASVLTSAGAAGVGLVAVLGAIAGGAAAYGFAEFVKEGISFNATIESAKIGIASLVANTYDVKNAAGQLLNPVEAFNAALGESDEIERKLQASAIKTGYLFQDILGFYNSILVAGAGLNLTLDQSVQLTQDIALAAGAIHLPVEKVNTGIKQILTGYTTVRNDLAKVLFPGESTKEINNQLKQWRQAGTLVDEVDKKLQVFHITQGVVSNSFLGLATAAYDAFKIFASEATLSIFNKIKDALKLVVNSVLDLSGGTVKLQPAFQKISDILSDILGYFGDQLFSGVKYVLDTLGGWADWLDQNRQQIDEIIVGVTTIAEEVGGILVDLVSIVGDVAQANNNTSNWVTATQYVALFFGLIRDILNIIIGAIETVAGLILFSWASALEYINSLIENTVGWLLKAVGLFDEATAKAASMQGFFGSIRQGTESFLLSGVERTNSGLNGQGIYGAQDRLNQNILNNPANKPHAKNSFTPRKGTGGSGGGKKGGADREAKDRLRAAQQLFDAIEKYQVANTKRDVELNKQANEQVLAIWQRRYDQGLESADDFYNKKQALAINDLDKEKNALEQQQKFAKQALSRNLGALQGKFQLSPEELDATIKKLEQLDPDKLATADTKTIKQASEYVKYLEQTAGITKDLTSLEVKRTKTTTGGDDARKDAARLDIQNLKALKGELADVFGDGGISDENNILKRISDDFPKILTETNKGLPGVKEAAEAIRNLGSADLSQVTDAISQAGVDFNGLSDEAKTFLSIVERLIFVAGQKQGTSAFSKIQSAFEFNNDSALRQFSNGNAGFQATLDAVLNTTKSTITELQPIVDSLQKKINDAVEGVGVATTEDIQNLEKLKRYLDDLKRNVPAQAVIDTNRKHADDTFGNTNDAIQAKQTAGILGAKQAREETEAAIRSYIQALQDEAAALEATGDKSLETQSKIDSVHVKIQQLTNDLNEQSIGIAQNINGLIGDAFSGFVSSIIQGTDSIGNSFRKMIAGILSGIASAIAQAILLKFVLTPLGLTGGSSGGIGGLLGGLFGGKKAEGGIISGPGTGTSDSAGLFALSHGEGVIPARRVSQYGSGMIQSIINGSFLPRMSFGRAAAGGIVGGSALGGRGTRIINTVDPNLVREFMAGPEGEEIIVNVIGRNPGLVQRVVS